MNLIINGKNQEIQSADTVVALLDQLGYGHNQIAVAVNQEFIPKSDYEQTTFSENDAVEIVAPMQGG